jgi:hypothetical protein
VPVVLKRGFRNIPGYPIGNPAAVFEWVDDPNEDQDFVDWHASLHPNRGCSLDRSGPDPALTWWYLINPSNTRTVTLSPGFWGHAAALDGTTSFPGLLDMTGLWTCDEHGRPASAADIEQ